MNNPLFILQTLDRNLHNPAELTIFGRSALALGYKDVLPAFYSTQDVDGILPMGWLQPPDGQEDFWQAAETTNRTLEPTGLYLTHLFREVDVILHPDWLGRRVLLEIGLARLTVFRPAGIDLILTKMARGDEDDLQDIKFLLQRESLTTDQLTTAFSQARVPEIPEIQELFKRAQPKVLALAGR